MVWDKQESRRTYWATRSSVRSFEGAEERLIDWGKEVGKVEQERKEKKETWKGRKKERGKSSQKGKKEERG